MGAPAWSWVKRIVLLLAILVGALLIALGPGLPGWLKLALFILGGMVGVAVAFREIPAFDPRGRIHWRLPRSPNRRCAVTFDDGPSQDTDRVLDILERYGVKATFFVLSANARRHPDTLKRQARAGHTIAIHGTTHRKLHRQGEAAIADEVTTAIAELTELGVPPARLYRTPHGLKNAAVFRVASSLGLELWAWSRGVWDTDRPPPAFLVGRARRLARNGMVLLLHDGRGDELTPDITSMVEALPGIIEGLRADGFSFVTLDQA